MYLPESYGTAVFFMFMTMLCWGSWANMTKIDSKWRFELFYWDYALGVFFTTLIFGLTLGSFGSSGIDFFSNIFNASSAVILKALLSGALFNIANILLVAAIAISGMAIAFPIGIGIALVVGTVLSYFVHPEGNPFALFIGVFLVLIAVILDGIAYKQVSPPTHKVGRGLKLALISGALMSLFYPLIAEAMVEKHPLTPYGAMFFFSLGLLLSNLIINPLLMKKPFSGPPLTGRHYLQGSKRQHLYGLLGGGIWCVGMTLNVIAATRAGPAIAYAFGQGATLIAAIWGIFIWRELGKGKNISFLISLMFLTYLLGLFAIGIAKVP